MTSKQIRTEKAKKYLANINDCGRFGRAFELSCARDKSRKTKVAEQNETDVYIKMLCADGKMRYIPAEAKTNGGRIDELLNGTKAKYIIYDLHFAQKHKASKKAPAWDEARDLPAPVIIPLDLFISKLQEFNAIKVINRNGEFDGYGIQVSSKKWFDWLMEYPVTFDREATVEWWEFDGLE